MKTVRKIMTSLVVIAGTTMTSHFVLGSENVPSGVTDICGRLKHVVSAAGEHNDYFLYCSEPFCQESGGRLYVDPSFDRQILRRFEGQNVCIEGTIDSNLVLNPRSISKEE